MKLIDIVLLVALPVLIGVASMQVTGLVNDIREHKALEKEVVRSEEHRKPHYEFVPYYHPHKTNSIPKRVYI